MQERNLLIAVCALSARQAYFRRRKEVERAEAFGAAADDLWDFLVLGISMTIDRAAQIVTMLNTMKRNLFTSGYVYRGERIASVTMRLFTRFTDHFSLSAVKELKRFALDCAFPVATNLKILH